MEKTSVDVKIPYSVEFRRHRHRKIEGGIYWDDGEIEIRTVTVEEAPVAYRIAPGDEGFGLEFDIRSYDGKLWWPLLRPPTFLSSKDYIGSATDSDGYFLLMMNLSPATRDSSREDTTEE